MTASTFSAPRRSEVGSSRSPRWTSAPAAVGSGETEHLVAGFEELREDVGADEARRAGEEDSHGFAFVEASVRHSVRPPRSVARAASGGGCGAAWVEHGTPPDRMIASKRADEEPANPVSPVIRKQLLCPYPGHAVGGSRAPPTAKR
jgi:hypothetical protein